MNETNFATTKFLISLATTKFLTKFFFFTVLSISRETKPSYFDQKQF